MAGDGRADLSWDESVRLDLRCVENWSLTLDLQILWKTLSAVVGRLRSLLAPASPGSGAERPAAPTQALRVSTPVLVPYRCPPGESNPGRRPGNDQIIMDHTGDCRRRGRSRCCRGCGRPERQANRDRPRCDACGRRWHDDLRLPTTRHTLVRVSVTTPPKCPVGRFRCNGRGRPGSQCRTASPGSKSAAPGRSPTSGQPPTGAACVTSANNGNCGPYAYRPISNSNGYTTYVGNNMWGCGNGNCGAQTVTAYDPGHWSATSTQASGNTAVLTYPNVQQLFTKTTNTDPAISAFASITSDFTETMNPQAGTDAEAAYDIWLGNTSGPNEIMIWVDNVAGETAEPGRSAPRRSAGRRSRSTSTAAGRSSSA